jgi:hypothetical protein
LELKHCPCIRAGVGETGFGTDLGLFVQVSILTLHLYWIWLKLRFYIHPTCGKVGSLGVNIAKQTAKVGLLKLSFGDFDLFSFF